MKPVSRKQQNTHVSNGPLKPVFSSAFSPHTLRDLVKLHALIYASTRDGLWILHGARALNAYLPVEFQSDTVDFDWIVQDTEMESWDHFLLYLRKKTGADIEIVHTKHANTLSLSVHKVRILDIMFINSFGFSLYKEETELMEIPFSITPNSMSPLMLPIPQQMFIRVCSFPHLIRTLQECIHDVGDLGAQNEWRRNRDQRTMRKIMYCQSLGFNPIKPTWIPVSLLDCKLGLAQYKSHFVPAPVPSAIPTPVPLPALAVPVPLVQKKEYANAETQTDIPKKECVEFSIQTDLLTTFEMSTQTDPMEPIDPMDKNKTDTGIQTEPVVIMTIKQLNGLKAGFLKQTDLLVEKTRLLFEKKITELQQKVISLKNKHGRLFQYQKQIISCCRYLFHGWKTDISFHKMYHEKLKYKFSKYKKSINLVKLLVMSLLENKSMTFKEWSFMNWAMFQESFSRHLEWFANEGIPGMVDGQLNFQDIPFWWKDQVNLFPFISPSVSYFVYNFLKNSPASSSSSSSSSSLSSSSPLKQDMFMAMRETSDLHSIYELRNQNSYITKQLTQFTYDVLESKKFGWHTVEFLNLPLQEIGQEYDNSKIKMEALVCLIVSSVLEHQVKNDASDRKILVTLQRTLESFDKQFELELEDESSPILFSYGKYHWQRPTPFHKLRQHVSSSNNFTDNFIESLPKRKRAGKKVK